MLLAIRASKGGAGVAQALGLSGCLEGSHRPLLSLFGDNGDVSPPSPCAGAGFRHRGSACSGPVL